MQSNTSEFINQENMIQLVVFHINEEEFAVPIEEIQEIIKASVITPIPDSPEFNKGIINVRGDIVITIDLKSLFSIQGSRDEASRHIIITKQNDSLFGLIVDEVTEVLRLNEDEIKPPPTVITEREKDYIKGVIVLENRLLILLDLSKVLSQEEFQKISGISKQFLQENNQDQNKGEHHSFVSEIKKQFADSKFKKTLEKNKNKSKKNRKGG